MQRLAPGFVLTIIALIVSVAVRAGTNLTLAWHEVALIALGVAAVASLALALPPGTFRPIAPAGLDIVDVYIRTGEIERRTAHMGHHAGKQRRRYLWNLLPLSLAIAIVATYAIAN